MEWFTSPARLIALVILTIVAVNIILRALRNRTERKGYSFPPSPNLLALLECSFFFSMKPWLKFTEWRAKYGDIVYFPFLGTHVIVLNSTSVASELLGKRSQIYSDRPSIPTAVPYGLDSIFAFSQYGEYWRLCRRIFQQTFRADAAPNFHTMRLRKARQLIVNIFDNPEDYPAHFSMFSVAQTMSAVYGYELSRNDPMFSLVDNYVKTASRGLTPQRMSLFIIFPFLMHIPGWLPGSRIKREANEAYTWRTKVAETQYRYTRERMEHMDHLNSSMVLEHITRMEKFDGSYSSEYETALKDTSASTVIVGLATTKMALMAFALAMAENPHIWGRAQAEIDAITGTDRLPEFDDRPSLPYVDAIVREVLRWKPVLPIGAPHTATRSDIYDGYYIPRGSIIFANIWAMSRDEVRYPDADKFMPERFLNAEGMLTDDDPSDFVFGFGRRRCPAHHTADVTLWSAIATMLATLDFDLAKDTDGNDIKFKPPFKGGIASQPNPFPCRLTPRQHVDKEVLDRILARDFDRNTRAVYTLVEECCNGIPVFRGKCGRGADFPIPSGHMNIQT